MKLTFPFMMLVVRGQERLPLYAWELIFEKICAKTILMNSVLTARNKLAWSVFGSIKTRALHLRKYTTN